ncbi:MAG: N-acetylgalactosamine-6-sulfatase, partial [Verrucomicrobia bacterium]
MTCRKFTITLALCLTAAAHPLAKASGQAAVSPAKANVLLIVSDDQGYRDLGCFGSGDVQTPHLDRLATGGIRLTSFYVAWPACTPSRGALLTGRYPQRNGVYDM